MSRAIPFFPFFFFFFLINKKKIKPNLTKIIKIIKEKKFQGTDCTWTLDLCMRGRRLKR